MSKEKKSFIKTLKKNPWVVSTGILAVLILVMIITGVGSCTGKVISEKKASEGLVSYFESAGVSGLSVSNVKQVGSMYLVNLLYEGENVPFYVTRDGYVVGNSLVSVVDKPTVSAPITESQSSYSQEDLEKISVTMQCLAQAGVKIYGANWCGYTKAFVETLGGFSAVTPIYVECTEESELCTQEGITGYPTTKINGEAYNGARTFEGLAAVTGCPVPELSTQVDSSATASC